MTQQLLVLFFLALGAFFAGYHLTWFLLEKIFGPADGSIREQVARDNSRSLNDPGRLLR